ncbi:MAG TPA: septal ring lytic transglycosylase RlpA family protein [Gallionellaceae bacterium]
MRIQTGLIVFTALLLAACGSAPTHRSDGRHAPPDSGGGYLPGDGPGSEDPARLAATPDAVPRNEPLHRYANRPYDALGVHYVPLSAPGSYKERGMASWYGKKFHGQRTSSGEVYNMYGMSAAHKTLPIPSYARVTNLRNGKFVIVRVNDRGPFLRGRIMDLSYAAASKLDIIASGSAEVEVESILPGQEPVAQPIVAEPVQVEPLKPAPAPPAIIPIATTPILPPVQQNNAVAAEEIRDGGGSVFLQLGSFHSPQGAQSFVADMRKKLGDFSKQIMIHTQSGLTRVRLGPYRTAEEARTSADQLEPRLGFKPFISSN